MDFDREVATKRRTRPQEVESLMHDLLQRQRAADEEDDPNADDLREDPTGDSGLPGRRPFCLLCLTSFSSISAPHAFLRPVQMKRSLRKHKRTWPKSRL